jgi:hypothetical protein
MTQSRSGGSGRPRLTATLRLPNGDAICTLTDVLDIGAAGRGRRFLARGPKDLHGRDLPDGVYSVEMADGGMLRVTITYVSLSVDELSSIVLGKIKT